MKKIIINSLVATLLFSFVAPSVGVLASETETENTYSITNKSSNNITPMSKKNTSLKTATELGITSDQINNILNGESPYITLKDGIAYDKNNNIIPDYHQGGVQTYGKLSWAVKALRKAWSSLPLKAQVAIGGTTGFSTLLDVVETFTGKVEDAVYAGCKTLGMSDNVAWWITKLLMLAL